MERHQSKGIRNRRTIGTLLALSILVMIPGLAFAGNRCDYCHGMPPQDSANGERIVATGAFKGSHTKHGASAAAESCVKCHGAQVRNYSSAHAAANQFNIQMASPINGYPGATYGSKGVSFPQTDNPVSATCSNANCHFRTETPAWGETASFNCSSCHTSPRGNSGSHWRHETLFSNDCSICHPNRTSFSHATSVTHRGVEFVSAITYSGQGKNLLSGTPFGTCSNIYCHSDGTRNPASSTFTSKRGVDPTWGGTLTGDCADCHGNYNGNTISTGSHTKHFNVATYGTALNCETCHAATVNSTNTIIVAGGKHVNTNIDVQLRNGGTYSADGHPAGGTPGSCTTYCHSSGKIGVSGVPGYQPLTWGTTANKGCATCHGTGTTTGAPDYPERTGAGTAQANSHTRHVSGKGISCQYCHISTTTDGTTIFPGAAHLNGTIDVSLSSYQGQSAGTYASGTKTCSATYCHGSGSSPSWGGTIAAGSCNSCHGDASSPSTLSGKHAAHLASTPDTGGQFTCNVCHASTAASNNAIAVEANHVNGMKNYSGAYAPSSTFNGGNCTTYCHSDGKGNYANPGSWTGTTTLGCDGCHGTLNGGVPQTGNHAKHLAAAGVDCSNCHNSTTTAPGTISSVANHINKNSTPVPGGTLSGMPVSFGYSATTCSNISCHSMGKFTASSVAWGAPSLGCTGCHGTLSAGHTRHVGNLLASVTFYGYTSNMSAGSEGASLPNYGFGCANCHPTNVSYHINGTVDVTLTPDPGTSALRLQNLAGATYSSNRCQNIYCHSDGNGVTVTTPVWGGTFSDPDRCRNCHGNAPSSGAHQAHAVGIHYDNIFTGTEGLLSPGSTGNVSHGVATQATTITCKTCHADTVATSRNKNATACTSCHSGDAATTVAKLDAPNGIRMHVNGVKNISFDTAPIRSKAQIRPTSFSLYSGLWSRNGGADNYKTGATSFDVAKVPLSNTMWNGAAKSCSNVVCHNLRGGASVLWTDTLSCESCHSKL